MKKNARVGIRGPTSENNLYALSLIHRVLRSSLVGSGRQVTPVVHS